MVAELIAALHDEPHGVMVTRRQLVSVEDDDLGSRHHFLVEAKGKYIFYPDFIS